MEQPKHTDPELRFGRRLPREVQFWLDTWNNVHASPHALFHYTDSTGLSGILRKQELWATHVYYVNDTQEFRYAQTLILDVIKERISKTDQTQSAQLFKLHESFAGHARIMESLWDPYIICFCESDSLLSQWRAYAGQGQGFAIGFSPGRLKSRLADLETATASAKMFRVIYEPTEQRQSSADSSIWPSTSYLKHSKTTANRMYWKASQSFSPRWHLASSIRHSARNSNGAWCSCPVTQTK